MSTRRAADAPAAASDACATESPSAALKWVLRANQPVSPATPSALMASVKTRTAHYECVVLGEAPRRHSLLFHSIDSRILARRSASITWMLLRKSWITASGACRVKDLRLRWRNFGIP